MIMKVEVLSDVRMSPDDAGGRGNCCAYGSTTCLKDGRLFCAYRQGTLKHSYDGVLVGQLSADGGEIWSEPITIFDGTGNEPVETFVSGSVLCADDGSLFGVFATVAASAKDAYVFSEEGFAQQRRYYAVRSFDGGESWCKPELMEVFDKPKLGIVGRSVVLPNGDILVGAAYPREVSSRMFARSISTDNGATLGPLVDMVGDPAGELNYDDPYFAVFDDGMVAGFFWTYRQDNEETVAVHRSVSLDNGRNWSQPRPVGLLGQLSVPLVMGGDRILVASNFRWEPDGIRLWLSHDRGESFDGEDPVQMWDAGENRIVAKPIARHADKMRNDGVWDALAKFTFGTPDLVDIGDGSALLTYYATQKGVTHMRACRFKV